MDPYLEMPPFWDDFVLSFLTGLGNSLLPRLLPLYDARIEEYRLRSVAQTGDARRSSRTQRRLRIIHRGSERGVTALELLSPANKVLGKGGLDAYLQKRTELLSSPSDLVELDLLRGGQRLPMAGPLPLGDYYAFIGRVGRKPRCQVIGWPLRSPMPTMQLPLLREDPELLLNLQALFQAAYEPALYDRRLRYEQPLDPPLRPTDASWVKDALPVR